LFPPQIGLNAGVIQSPKNHARAVDPQMPSSRMAVKDTKPGVEVNALTAALFELPDRAGVITGFSQNPVAHGGNLIRADNEVVRVALGQREGLGLGKTKAETVRLFSRLRQFFHSGIVLNKISGKTTKKVAPIA
jgi:hypothetical protein